MPKLTFLQFAAAKEDYYNAIMNYFAFFSSVFVVTTVACVTGVHGQNLLTSKECRYDTGVPGYGMFSNNV